MRAPRALTAMLSSTVLVVLERGVAPPARGHEVVGVRSVDADRLGVVGRQRVVRVARCPAVVAVGLRNDLRLADLRPAWAVSLSRRRTPGQFVPLLASLAARASGEKGLAAQAASHRHRVRWPSVSEVEDRFFHTFNTQPNAGYHLRVARMRPYHMGLTSNFPTISVRQMWSIEAMFESRASCCGSPRDGWTLEPTGRSGYRCWPRRPPAVELEMQQDAHDRACNPGRCAVATATAWRQGPYEARQRVNGNPSRCLAVRRWRGRAVAHQMSPSGDTPSVRNVRPMSPRPLAICKTDRQPLPMVTP
jgi:hypothetical protein